MPHQFGRRLAFALCCQLIEIRDNYLGQTTRYEYDLAGNRVAEKMSQKTLLASGLLDDVVYQDNHLVYDAQHRLRAVFDGRSDVRITYDLAGNRKQVTTHVINAIRTNDSTTGQQVQSADHTGTTTFEYDAMNRQVLSVETSVVKGARWVLDLRNDPYISGLMAGELIKRDRSRIEARIGRELKTTELYLAHFLGTASAGKFLSLSAEDPDKVAKAAFGRAARANRAIFTEKEGGKRRSLTVAEVHEKLDGMIDRRLSQYQAIADLAAQQQAEEQAEPILDARLRINESVPPSLALHSVQ